LPHKAYFTEVRGSEGEPLSIDVVRLGAESAQKVIVVSSGSHGVEGFAGSAIQLGVIVLDWHRQLPEDMAVVLIHALNPYGMSWGRRECEGGIDLTRNLSHHLYPPFPNPEYEFLHPVLVPQDVSAETLSELPERFEHIVKQHSIDNPGHVLRIGQYTHPQGLTYHGLEPCWSTRCWIDIVAKSVAGAKDVMLIDIHTGFGDYGDLLVQNPSYRHDSPAYKTLCEWLGRVPAGYSDDGSILQHRIETFEALHRHCEPDARVAAMYFEFGTKDPGEYIEPWVRNNWHYHYGDKSSPEAVAARCDFSDFCYIRKSDWKQNVWEKGLAQLELLRDRMT